MDEPEILSDRVAIIKAGKLRCSPVACTYNLSVVDCLDGMVKAMQFGFWNIHDSDLEEYENFEQVENGDLNWLVKGRILAFAGPSFQRHVSPEGYCTLAPSDYIPYFQEKKVDLVVRLNKKNYHERDFIQAGIRHVEHFFVDGSCPSMKVLNAVIQDFEAVPADKAFAVHCKAGLGRTGTCIGAYLMKHFRFTAAEVIGWMRLCRPGCVIGPQQQFLETIQDRMYQLGDLAKPVPRNTLSTTTTATTGPPRSSSAAAAMAGGGGAASQQQQQQKYGLPNDAIEGRPGQAEALLAARATGKSKTPTTPEIPMEKEKQYVVTPEE